MSMQDPIADMFTRVRNGLSAQKEVVSIPFSKMKMEIANFLVNEGYVAGCAKGTQASGHPSIEVQLKYHAGAPVIEMIKRVSRPSLRIYKSHEDLPKVYGGFGVAMISTSKGLVSDRKARELGVGGEIIGYVA
ncbi:MULTISPECIES: 30S ribosomal protein S8 [Francisella]|uniref:Small ribosomal subunit protein uS8 n=1 Tax=Francisella adeliensis TaxID=2007306 RepID=A0A2Z4XVZ7_9GAMM|nr:MULTISPECIES: 30S ribosomal protein S8 [Francisella]AXA33024.1 30S ribosomal protein S8 [Francisella adeliensis]MBK2086090.1 30S ribosomal protein S8 [Francisella adeliensis]MBK2096746.1 30S ribosomal protein S8 [Francisella adeliensis]QIW11250.1 30S ribosomal protein S8 [Francisella adeliensis]QIW13126.1 30S ribosomal protein S8 [Francisella adeliensis]